jgi:hypothetical protein
MFCCDDDVVCCCLLLLLLMLMFTASVKGNEGKERQLVSESDLEFDE